MSRAKIFKKVLLPCAAGVSAAANSDGHTFGPNCVHGAAAAKSSDGTKPSDLPIYAKQCLICRNVEPTQSPPSSMEETVGNIRRELWVWQDNLKGYRHKIVDVYRKGFSKADSSIDFLREPANSTHRFGAIAIAGLTGYILGMRRGKIRRLFYGTFGAAGMAAVCYPEEAKEYFEMAVLEARKYFIVAYHFIYGESPQVPEWLEKFVGPLGGPSEGEPKSTEKILEPVKTAPSQEKSKSDEGKQS